MCIYTHIQLYTTQPHRAGWCGANSPAFDSRSASFEFLPGHRLTWLGFSGFSQFLQADPVTTYIIRQVTAFKPLSFYPTPTILSWTRRITTYNDFKQATEVKRSVKMGLLMISSERIPSCCEGNIWLCTECGLSLILSMYSDDNIICIHVMKTR